jgi:hypothetical protein
MTKHTPATIFTILFVCCIATAFQTQSTWTTFESPEGRFSIVLPSQPKIETREVDSALGKLTMYSYSSSNNVGHYMVSFGDYPKEATDDAQREAQLDGVRGGVLKGLQAEILSENKITLNGYPGREFKAKRTVDGVEVVFNWKILLVGRRLYQVAAVTSSADSNSPDIAKFASSFHLLNK